MASFVLDMAHSGHLKFGTMQGYTWSVQADHVNQFGAASDPLDGVADWGRFMQALEVQSFVDSSVEPRRMLPFMLLVNTLLKLNSGIRMEAALGCLMCMMYYTMSRSESPLPKSANSFDNQKHLRRCDVRLLFNQYVEWGLGSIKQDTRSRRTMQDPDRRDWKPCGECSGVLSMRYWFDAYASLSAWSNNQQPFFYGDDGKCLTYGSMLSFMRRCMTRCNGVTQPMADMYGFHGLRVLGYNCWRAAEGEDIAALQGGWGSLAHRIYGRDDLNKILGMAQKGAHYAASHALAPMPLDDTPPQDAVAPSPAALDKLPSVTVSSTGKSSGPGPSSVSDSTSDSNWNGLPDDAVIEVREAPAKSYKIFHWNNDRFKSWKRLRAAYLESSFISTLRSMGYGMRSP